MDDSGSNSKKRKSQAEGEGSKEKKRNVIMGEEILGCSVCLVPLRPEIFQVNAGYSQLKIYSQHSSYVLT
jgi:hypothetical protein